MVRDGVLLDWVMAKVKDSEIKNLSTTKREFMSALKKVSQRIEKPRHSSKMK